jgi:hypothetical protein
LQVLLVAADRNPKWLNKARNYPQGQQRRLTEIRPGGECQNSDVEIIILLAPDHIAMLRIYFCCTTRYVFLIIFLSCRLRLLLEGK